MERTGNEWPLMSSSVSSAVNEQFGRNVTCSRLTNFFEIVRKKYSFRLANSNVERNEEKQ